MQRIQQEPREIHRRDVGLYVAGLLVLSTTLLPRGVVQMLRHAFRQRGRLIRDL